MKIAIVGGGISGLVCAHKLHTEHDIALFEAGDYLGGHTHTHSLEQAGQQYRVDSGFIVYNYPNYPNFTALLKEVGLEPQPTKMSFSVKCEKSRLEYNGTSLNSLFAQRSNLLRPRFWRMVRDILRFNKLALELHQSLDQSITLREFLRDGNFGPELAEHYVIPMGAALWSSSADQMLDFPARFYIQFFANHGMLNVNDRPDWFVVPGGSNEYVKRISAPFSERVFLSSPVQQIRRFDGGVELHFQNRPSEQFDAVFIACHSDQALKMLAQPTPAEKRVLGAIPYQRNDVLIHTDTTIMPRRKLAWAAWNYHIPAQPLPRVGVTYNMNILQTLDSPEPFLVTLNSPLAIRDDKVLKAVEYDHPLFTPEGVSMQSQQPILNTMNRTYYCGAYWGFGFHEDGVRSALNALDHFAIDRENYGACLPVASTTA